MPSGACIVALGEKVGALYSADDSLRHGIEAAARRSDEGDLHHFLLKYHPCHPESSIDIWLQLAGVSSTNSIRIHQLPPIGIWAMPLESQYKELIKVNATTPYLKSIFPGHCPHLWSVHRIHTLPHRDLSQTWRTSGARAGDPSPLLSSSRSSLKMQSGRT